MKIKFSSDLIKLTLEEHEQYAGRSLTMEGEALYSGFDAFLSTAKWLSSFSENVSEEVYEYIKEVVQKHNETSDYIISFVEE